MGRLTSLAHLGTGLVETLASSETSRFSYWGSVAEMNVDVPSSIHTRHSLETMWWNSYWALDIGFREDGAKALKGSRHLSTIINELQQTLLASQTGVSLLDDDGVLMGNDPKRVVNTERSEAECSAQTRFRRWPLTSEKLEMTSKLLNVSPGSRCYVCVLSHSGETSLKTNRSPVEFS